MHLIYLIAEWLDSHNNKLRTNAGWKGNGIKNREFNRQFRKELGGKEEGDIDGYRIKAKCKYSLALSRITAKRPSFTSCFRSRPQIRAVLFRRAWAHCHKWRT